MRLHGAILTFVFNAYVKKKLNVGANKQKKLTKRIAKVKLNQKSEHCRKLLFQQGKVLFWKILADNSKGGGGFKLIGQMPIKNSKVFCRGPLKQP